MKGLLLKDFYTLIKQMKFFIVFIAFFSLLPGYSTSSFALVYAAMMPISALAYDERCKWDSLAVMMPYKATSIVLGKYILGYVTLGGVFIITALSQNIFSAFKGMPFDFEGLVSLFITANVALLVQAVNLPVMFRFGVEKGRLAFFAGIAILVMCGIFFGSKLTHSFSIIEMNPTPYLLGILLVSIGANLFSIQVSKRVYEKRDF